MLLCIRSSISVFRCGCNIHGRRGDAMMCIWYAHHVILRPYGHHHHLFQRLRWPPTIEHINHVCTQCICAHSAAMGSATIATGHDIAADMCGGEDVIKVTQNQALWHIQIGLVNIKIRANQARILSIIHYTNVLWWTIGCVSTFPPMGGLLAPWWGCWRIMIPIVPEGVNMISGTVR